MLPDKLTLWVRVGKERIDNSSTMSLPIVNGFLYMNSKSKLLRNINTEQKFLYSANPKYDRVQSCDGDTKNVLVAIRLYKRCYVS